MSTTNTLSADAKYDDQGIYVSLIVGGVLLVIFGGLTAFLHYTPILWLKRFYRPNHTVEPRLPTQAASVAAVAAARRVERENSPATSPPLSPMTTLVLAEHTERPYGRKGRAITRYKRLGISLSVVSTFFVSPTWRDWISIEERSLHDRQEGALSSTHREVPLPPPRHTSDRSFVPLHVSSPEGPSCGVRREADDSLHSPSSLCGIPQQSYGAVEMQPSRTSASPDVSPMALPKTPVDPLVSTYLFTLKFFFALTFLGEICTVWIMFIAKKDNYMERSLILRDAKGCSTQDDNQTGCELLRPYCYYRGDGLGCGVVALHGLYDLTVSNIQPRSHRWVWVGLLNLGFCAAVVALTLFYVRKVGQYVEAVMENQMRHSLGYRVVCVRGLHTTNIGSEHAFKEAFLSLSAYFPSAAAVHPVGSASHVRPGTRGEGRHHSSPSSPSGTIIVTEAVENEEDEDQYVVCDCPGLNCLFSTAGVHYYVVRRANATFTEPGKVQEILITREPPCGMLDLIANAESAMAHLQEAIADEKALRRKLALRHNARPQHRPDGRQMGDEGDHLSAPPATDHWTRALAGTSLADNGRETVLLMRAPFPACCDRVPAVPYYERLFYYNVQRLNAALVQVPQQPIAGAAFVVFKDSLSAYEFASLFTARFGGVCSPCTATIAGPPGRVLQSSLTAGRWWLWLRFFLIFFLYVLLILTWSIPVSVLGSLNQLSQLSSFAPLRRYADLPEWVRSLLDAYLPVVALALLNVALPHIIRLLVRAMGAFNRAECDGGQLYLQYVFMVVTAVIFQVAFQGAMGRLAELLANHDNDGIVNFFVSCITPTNGYFYAKVITATCLSTWVDLLDPVGLLKVWFFRGSAHVQRNYDALFLPCEFEFPRLLSFDLMILAMGLLFHMTAPLLGLLVVGYFLVRYWTQRTKQSDRYRPTLSSAHDCTDFSVPAQVIRCVMWLYCFSEVCGVLLMSLRNSKGGVLLCSLTLATGIALTCYVYMRTRRWTASLANARRFARKNAARSDMLSSPAPGVAPPLRSAGLPSAEAASQVAVAVPEPTARKGHSASPHPPSAENSTNSQLYSTAGAPYEVDGNDVVEPQMSAHNRSIAVQQDGALDSYEHVTLHQVLFDTTRNPFLSHLLPRKPGLIMRYQPKHQRLAPIDAAAEVRAMKATDFVVERYWDRGMTWFEEDADVYRDVDISDGEAPAPAHRRCGEAATRAAADVSAQRQCEILPRATQRQPKETDVALQSRFAGLPRSGNGPAIAPYTAVQPHESTKNVGSGKSDITPDTHAAASTRSMSPTTPRRGVPFSSAVASPQSRTFEGNGGGCPSPSPPSPSLPSCEERRRHDDELDESLHRSRMSGSGPPSPRGLQSALCLVIPEGREDPAATVPSEGDTSIANS